MRAARITSYGEASGIELADNLPTPEAGDNQVLVEVTSVSINPFDVTLMKGYLKDKMPLELPYIPGGDFSGVVAKSPKDNSYKVGDKVFGQAIVLNGGSGTFAEFCVANLQNIALLPNGIDPVGAGALPLVGASAVQAILEHVALTSGQKILIHGGAGGIGHIAIQLAKALGAYVATTVRLDDFTYVRSIGADLVLDYKNQRFEDQLRDFDAVFDTVGGEITNKSFAVLKKGGTLVSMKGAPDQQLAQDFNIKAVGQATITNTTRLNLLSRFIENKKIKVSVSKMFTLDEVREAFDYFEKEHFIGKVAIKIKV